MFESFYEALWIFFLYSFFGWCVEVVYFAVNKGRFVNRGFLAGPVCPIYGIGILAVVAVLSPWQDNMLLLYLGSVIVTSTIEFLLGWLSESILHERLWDYSAVPFNLKGYICLKFSLVWGIACVGVIKLFHPAIMRLVRWIPQPLGTIALCVLGATIVTDLIITGSAALEIPRQLKSMEEIEKGLKAISNGIGEGLSGPVLNAREQYPEFEAKMEARLKELNVHNATHRRLLKAFPDLQQHTEERLNRWHEQNEKRINELRARISAVTHDKDDK